MKRVILGGGARMLIANKKKRKFIDITKVFKAIFVCCVHNVSANLKL